MADLTDVQIEQRLKEKEKRDSDPRNKERYYVTNAELLEELIKWRDSAEKVEDRDCPSEKLGFMFMELARKITNHSFFRNYSSEIKQDMMGYAYEKMISGLPNYNFKFTNAFAYFSQACFNAFKTTLSKHYKQVNIKRDVTKRAIINLETYIPNSSISKCLNNQFDGNDYDNFSDY